DVEARARNDDTTEYRTAGQLECHAVQHVEKQACDEEQGEGAGLDARPYRLQRDVRTSRVLTLWTVLFRNHRSFSSPVPSSLSTWWTRIAPGEGDPHPGLTGPKGCRA